MAEDGLLQMEGIIYEYSSLYSGLVSAITSQLMIDANIHNIEIKYIVSDRCPPVSIHNDVGVRVFLDQKKSNVDFFTKYPLCITLKNIAIDNQDSIVVVDRRHSDVSRTLTNFDLYSSNSIRLIGVNLDGVVDENTDEGNGVISDLSNLFIAEKQIYNDKETLMEVMRHYGVVEKFKFLVTRSSSSCYYLKCPADNCSWMMNSSCLNQSKLFKIRKYCVEHTCSVRDRVNARRQGITDVVVVLIMDKFIDPSTVYTPKDIAEEVLKVHDVALTYMQAWRAKQKAIKLVRGDPAESYAKLPALRGAYGGTMLTASTIDPGGHILPLAYAIVDSENDASWTWFFEQFREVYGERENMCFMSNRNESIWKGTARVYPGLEHFACIWHLCCNVLKNFHRNTEDLKKLFFTMAKAYAIQQFEAIMQRIDHIDPRIRDYLYDIGYSKWSRAYSKCKRTWTMTSNVAESLNNVNRIARMLPVISLLEFMRVTVQRWIHKHNEEPAKTRSELTKKYDLMLQKSIALSSSMRVIPSTVDMHVVVDGPKRLKNFQDTYAIPVEPLPCESIWDIPSYISEPKLMPPGPKRAAGRPQLER
uniref:Putative transposase, identical n=1 Tax=Solanum tuberosum TaxID=4113 RepID=Q60CX5_SOLTU|nr:Putative transposase, identical [Solanum tuberosum]